MASIRLGVGRERQSIVLIIGLARKPLLVFRHRHRARTEKGKSVESIVEYDIIQFSRLRFVDDLPRLVEALQGEQDVAKVAIKGAIVRSKTETLAKRLRSPIILSLFSVHDTQTDVGCGVSRVA